MAKQTALQILNKVLSNLGEAQESSLTSLSGLALFAFNTINEVLHDLATEYKLRPLEADGSITLLTGTATYANPSDMHMWDKDSFRYNDEQDITYVTAQKQDRDNKKQTDTGIPDRIYNWGGFFRPYKVPSADANSKVINYRYWQIPTLYSTDTSTGTSFVPEGFDLTLLADMATYKVLHYKANPEANFYYRKIWGDQRLEEGRLNKFLDMYASPDVLDENIVTEPMESRNQSRFVQSPITS